MNYNDADSDWYWVYSLLEITTTTDHINREELSTGNFLNSSSEIVLNCEEWCLLGCYAVWLL
jgi:hypothetical protein